MPHISARQRRGRGRRARLRATAGSGADGKSLAHDHRPFRWRLIDLRRFAGPRYQGRAGGSTTAEGGELNVASVSHAPERACVIARLPTGCRWTATSPDPTAPSTGRCPARSCCGSTTSRCRKSVCTSADGDSMKRWCTGRPLRRVRLPRSSSSWHRPGRPCRPSLGEQDQPRGRHTMEGPPKRCKPEHGKR